jgi:hypothetical protein
MTMNLAYFFILAISERTGVLGHWSPSLGKQMQWCLFPVAASVLQVAEKLPVSTARGVGLMSRRIGLVRIARNSGQSGMIRAASRVMTPPSGFTSARELGLGGIRESRGHKG